jgi:hypothetical protein
MDIKCGKIIAGSLLAAFLGGISLASAAMSNSTYVLRQDSSPRPLASANYRLIPGLSIKKAANISPVPTSLFEANPAFQLGEAYSYPNPARDKFPILHFECGLADSVEFKIYDLTGSLIHTKRLSAQEWVLTGEKYAYEYIWNTSEVPSGVYIYRATASKSGTSGLRASGKIALIK